MNTAFGHLTFCTNIFPGASWQSHFQLLRNEVPVIKNRLAPNKTFGIGLRLSHEAACELIQPEQLKMFKQWLKENDCVVYTMNGFPYGNFHRTRVKDQVHAPDWTTGERLDYTLCLFKILAELLPEKGKGGISTSPLSYKYWFEKNKRKEIRKECTKNIVELVLYLFQMHQNTGKWLHVDIEPEADGLVEDSNEFIDWYLNDLLPEGSQALKDRFALTDEEAAEAVRRHVQLCYDVCHFAIGFEKTDVVVRKLKEAKINIGKWQLSAALKINFKPGAEEKEKKRQELKKFDEPVYLHQVVAWSADESLLRYRDLPDAFHSEEALQAEEWRAHFHVPVFVKDFGLLQSTQDEIKAALELQKAKKLSAILEVETYTWEVLPPELKRPLSESIIRELGWVMNYLNMAS